MTKRLGTAQIAILRLIQTFGSTCKGEMDGRDWRRIDGLEYLGLVQKQFVPGTGMSYFLSATGRDALKQVATPAESPKE